MGSRTWDGMRVVPGLEGTCCHCHTDAPASLPEGTGSLGEAERRWREGVPGRKRLLEGYDRKGEDTILGICRQSYEQQGTLDERESGGF